VIGLRSDQILDNPINSETGSIGWPHGAAWLTRFWIPPPTSFRSDQLRTMDVANRPGGCAPLGRLNPKSGLARARLDSPLPPSQSTLVDFDFDRTFLFHQSAFFASPQALYSARYSSAQSRLELRETPRIDLHARIVITQPQTLGRRISLKCRNHRDSSLLPIIISRPSHLQWIRRLRLSGARSRVHFARYIWSRI